MDGFGMNFVSKAQNSAFRRWFHKPKPVHSGIENIPSNSQSVESSPTHQHEVTNGEEQPLPDSNDQGVHSSTTHDEAAQERDSRHETTPVSTGNGPVSQRDVTLLNDFDDGSVPPMLEEEGNNDLPLGEEVLLGEADADDYTDGEGGIVNGFDGMKCCPSLLLTYEWTTNTHKMIRFQRMVLREEQVAQAKLEALSRYEDVLNREIMNHKNLIAVEGRPTSDSDVKDPGEEGPEDEPDRLDNLQDELENLERLEKGIQVKRAVIDSNVKRRRNLLQGYQAEVNQYLEEAFISAQAIEPQASDEEDPTFPEFSLQEEYQKLVTKMQELNGGPVIERPLEVASADKNVQSQAPVLTPERQARVAASRALWEAKENLQYARVQFEDKDRLRNQDFQQNVQAEQRGEPTTDLSIEDFDLRWVVRFREITRNVLDAEREVSQARAAAKKVGLRLEYDDQSSCFPDDAADGTPELMSSDIDSPEVFAEDPRMIAWMESLADAVDPEFSEPIEVDEWGSGEELDANDSASVVGEYVARDSKRRRIDAWQRACRIDAV